MVRRLPQLIALASLLAACARHEPCQLAVWIRKAPAVATAQADFSGAELVGSWNGWARPGIKSFESKRSSDGVEWMGAVADLPEGRFQYAILLGGKLLADEASPRTAFLKDPYDASAADWGTEVSEVELVACQSPAITSIDLRQQGDDGLVMEAAVQQRAGAAPQMTAEIRQAGKVVDTLLVTVSQSDSGYALHAEATGLPRGKYTATLSSADGSIAAREASGFVESQPGPRLLEDGLVYQVMIDRFRGPGPLTAPASPGDRAGGTLAGVLEALRAGYFDKLGVTTLWLSPVYQNPEGHYPGADGHSYEAYHGYWPLEPRAVEPRLGGEDALDALVFEAHASGLRVILDAVPNHVFKDHPYYRDHSFAAAGKGTWFNDGPDACVCGTPGCGWGDKIETCWFTDYLPDLDWRRPQVMDQGSADLVWWMQRFDLDGLRIDAVPMMPRAGLRRMTSAIRGATSRVGLDGLLLGEVYTGPGPDGRDQIRIYLDPELDGLDSAFDFPLMWTMRDVIAHGLAGFDTLERELAEGDVAWKGSGSTMARIIGNHDTTRFISEAAGDAGNDGWTDPAQQPATEEPYRRARLAIAFTLSLPGLPVLYYGDEVGLAGGGDPDSRRVMPDMLGALPTFQAQLLEDVGRMGRARLDVPALRRGERRVLWTDSDHEVVVRDEPEGLGGGPAFIVLSRAAADSSRVIAGLPDGDYRDVLTKNALTVQNRSATVFFPALSVAVYVREGSACLQ